MANKPITVDLKGPLFQTDAGRTVRDAINKLVIEVSKEGVNEVKAELYQGHGVDSGAFRKGIKRKKRGFLSTVYASNAMIASWLQGTSKRNRTTRFAGYGIFTKAYHRTDQGAGEEARRIAAQLVKELGG